MAESLLAKLKIKPIPKVQETFEITIKKPADKEEITIKTKIIDKTKHGLIKREEFIETIRGDFAVKSATAESALTKDKGPKPKPIKVSELPMIKIMENPEKLNKKVKLTEIYFSPQKESEELMKESMRRAATKKDDVVKEGDEPEAAAPKITKRLTPKPKATVLEGPIGLLLIGDELVENRMKPKEENILIRASSYYMNNRQIFINFITSLLSPYKADIEADEKELSCDKKTGAKDMDFSLLTHQKIVRDYINLYTPYRGLLLYHGLGSGKTCSSIAIAEGLKHDKKVLVMTPASLETNYMEELKKCADFLYKKNQYWEFIYTGGDRELANKLSFVLGLPIEFINKQGGAWLVNIKKEPNYEKFSAEERESLNVQIEKMIRAKYKMIHL